MYMICTYGASHPTHAQWQYILRYVHDMTMFYICLCIIVSTSCSCLSVCIVTLDTREGRYYLRAYDEASSLQHSNGLSSPYNIIISITVLKRTVTHCNPLYRTGVQSPRRTCRLSQSSQRHEHSARHHTSTGRGTYKESKMLELHVWLREDMRGRHAFKLSYQRFLGISI